MAATEPNPFMALPVVVTAGKLTTQLLGTPEKIERWMMYWFGQIYKKGDWDLPNTEELVAVLSCFINTPNLVITGQHVRILHNPRLVFPLTLMTTEELALVQDLQHESNHKYFVGKIVDLNYKKSLSLSNFSHNLELSEFIPKNKLMLGFMNMHIKALENDLVPRSSNAMEQRYNNLKLRGFMDLMISAYSHVISFEHAEKPSWSDTHAKILAESVRINKIIV